LCPSCELLVGEGATYHFWGTTGGDVFPLSIDWSDKRYELAAFYFSTDQILHTSTTPQHMANPYWGGSLSRRWQIASSGPWRAFFGFGLAYKSESVSTPGENLSFMAVENCTL
jgi:hypothetical protein